MVGQRRARDRKRGCEEGVLGKEGGKIRCGSYLKVRTGRGGYVGHLLNFGAGGLDLGWLARWRQLATINLRFLLGRTNWFLGNKEDA